ncbi:hypothetical protein HK100_011128 [Physocladia obscura]|uniref:Haloacid dehalogenase-like hydrolase n=1 Tax=Physocladia obscura TaxID=109957 RepID=A0AAD5XII6_9FUNG|nr:hypothetical protein HK100_011128 [Physocladia obscura]
MGFALPQLIATDLDGTLLTPQHTVTKRTTAALRKLQQQFGVKIVLASGRSPRSVQKVIDNLNDNKGNNESENSNLSNGNNNFANFESNEFLFVPDAVLCCNGALTFDPLSKQISNPRFISLDAAITAVRRLRSLVDTSSNLANAAFACEVVWIDDNCDKEASKYSSDTFFVCDKQWKLYRSDAIYYKHTVAEDSFESFLESLKLPDGRLRGGVIKLMALDKTKTAAQLYDSLPQDMKPVSPSEKNQNITPDADLAVTYSGPYFLEVAAAGVSKGLGLELLCTSLDIKRENIVAFGDLLNDAEMLQFAGQGLCMGNGHPDMKKLADRVIGTNTEEGVAEEIESWFRYIIPE